MKNCNNTLLFGLLIMIVLYFQYKSTLESFQIKQQAHIPNCGNPNFNIEGTIETGLKYCAKINGVMKGCQEFDENSKRNKFIPFGIFGTYIDSLAKNDVDKCMEHESATLSKWGLCDDNLLKEIGDWKYPENDLRLKSINMACQHYKNEYKKNAPKIN